jgi:hypothetical protein
MSEHTEIINDLITRIKRVLIEHGCIKDGPEFSAKEYKLMGEIVGALASSKFVERLNRDEKQTDDDLEAEYQRGYDEGYEAGQDDSGGEYDNGYNSGYDAGYEEGYEAGTQGKDED